MHLDLFFFIFFLFLKEHLCSMTILWFQKLHRGPDVHAFTIAVLTMI